MGDLVMVAAKRYHRLKEQETQLLSHWPRLDEVGTLALSMVEKDIKSAALELAAAVEAELVGAGKL